ncbi:MAG: sigma-E factor regulatory protein RseB domain-containing protein [Armatimonadota bacterium]
MLKRNTGSYKAEIITSTRYAGKIVKSRARVLRDGSSERIDYLSPMQKGMWVTTVGNTTHTYLPNRKQFLSSTSDVCLPDAEKVKTLLHNYSARIEGTGTIAGRPTYQISLQPLTGNGPSKKIWIDREYYTILKSIDYSIKGEPLSEMQVTNINYNFRCSPSKFDVACPNGATPVTIAVPMRLDQLESTLHISVNKPSYVPEGYKLEGSYLLRYQCSCGHHAAQLTYTNGLNTISVFQTPEVKCKSISCNMDGGTCMMRESQIARLGQVRRDGKTVVVVADILPDEVRKIAESVR